MALAKYFTMDLSDRGNVHKGAVAALCLAGLLFIGMVDYAIGYRVSLLFFYAIPVGVAALYVGPVTAAVLALVAVVLSKAGDWLSGMPYPGHSILFWNCTIPFTFFLIVIAALGLLNKIRKKLEITVRQRNTDLRAEVLRRGRLENDVIELSDREHRRFGLELHNLVSHELAGIAINIHLLAQNLGNPAEAERARAVADEVDRALTRARNIARSYFALGFDVSGMAQALREIASRTEKLHCVTCSVRCPDDLVIDREDVATHLYRIAQEALQNAVQHAAASRIDISLERVGDHFRLVVEDNGKGLSPALGKKNKPGLSVMAYRAETIGGELRMERPADGGTRVLCIVPAVRPAPAASSPRAALKAS